MAVGLKAPEELLPVKGIRLSAVSAPIYRVARPDLVLMAVDAGSTAAGAFTRNVFCAAPVTIARSHLSSAAPRYCLINAGNANAGTGARGTEAALATCARVAELGRCRVEEVVPFSTGVIGEYLPVDSIRQALPALFDGLREDVWLDCARAIMTTDTVPKGASRRIELDGVPVSITGIAKGAGMIHPDMATLLAFIATDAAVSAEVLNAIRDNALAGSFNTITVDGDTSTNDSFLIVATGRCGLPRITDRRSPAACMLAEGISDVCRDLACAVVRDGEGATKFITVKVEAGRSTEECSTVARCIATSPLVKTAFYASDPNWGRILAAIGRSGLPGLDIGRISVYLDEVCIVEHGCRAALYTEADGQRVMARPEITILVGLQRGGAQATLYTCDLSERYVRINADYRS